MPSTEITSPVILDETGKRIVSELQAITNAIKGGGTIYGFYIDPNESDPEARVSYLADAVGMTPAAMNFTSGKFDYGSWENAFFVPRPCMLKSNGTVDYYLNPDDYTKKADGSASDVANTSYDGNAMMEWGQNGKKIYTKIVPANENKGASIFIADYKADDDYTCYPFHNCEGNEVDHFYTPIYNGSLISDGTNNVMRSLSGQTVSNTLTASEEITAAELNNPGTAKLWGTEVLADIQLINFLLILMAKSTDTQTAYGEGLHTNGTEAINNGFTTGVHNAKGLFYGTNSGTIASGSYGNAVKVFGMENWWGFQWRRYRGHVMVAGAQKIKLTYGQEDGSTTTGYNLTGSGYKTLAAPTITGSNGGYIAEEFFNEDAMVPVKADGSSGTYYTDGLYFNNSSTRVAFRGGISYNEAHVGALAVALNHAASNSYWYIGAALSCKPLA